MATIGNKYLDDLMARASSPIQYQDPNQQQQQVKQQQAPHSYSHNFNNNPIMRNGIQYSGTHDMKFGDMRKNPSINDFSSFTPEQRIASQQNYGLQTPAQEYRNADQTSGKWAGLNSALSSLDRVNNQAELAMKRTVIPMANRKNAMGILNMAMDYDIKNRTLANEQSYRNSALDIQREQNKIASAEQQSKDWYYRNGGKSAIQPRDPLKDQETRSKIAEQMVSGYMGEYSEDPNAKAMAIAEYTRSGRLPHRFWDDNGVIRPVYYKQGAQRQQQQQQRERWVSD